MHKNKGIMKLNIKSGKGSFFLAMLFFIPCLAFFGIAIAHRIMYENSFEEISIFTHNSLMTCAALMPPSIFLLIRSAVINANEPKTIE